jgi:hypothetical protein
VLGSLPSRRLGVESPRRAQARRAGARAPTEAPPEPAAADPGSSGLEDLARAGAGLAFGTAAAGLRLAGRTVGGIGRVVGRR